MRIAFQQPSLAKYRIPFFRGLNRVKGFDVDVFYAQRSGIPNVEAKGFQAFRVDDGRLPFLQNKIAWNSAQWRLSTNSTYDAIVLPANLRYLSLHAGLLRSKSSRAKTLLWGHHLGKQGRDWVEQCRIRLLNSVGGVVCYGYKSAARLIDLGLPEDRVFVAPNAIDQDPISEASESYRSDPGLSAKFREKYNLQDRHLILFVSRPKPRNEIHRVVQAAAELIQKGHKVSAAIVGKPNSVVEELQKQGRELGISEFLHFPGELYQERELAPWFCEADVLYYPAQIGLSAHHAMGYGVPVVAGRVAGVNNPELELIRHGENGYVFDVDDMPQIIESIEGLICDVSLRKRLGAESLRTVSEIYSLDEMISGFDSAIRSIGQ